MKSLVILGLFLCATAVHAQKFIRLGTELAGSHDASFSGDSQKEDVSAGFSIGVEGIRRIESFGLGAGIEYQIPREVKGFEGKFNFVPIYVLARYYMSQSKQAEPYLGLRVGYNLYFGNEEYTGGEGELSGGVYYGVGGGVEFQNFFMELGFSQNSGTFNIFGSDVSIDYSKLNLGFGVKF